MKRDRERWERRYAGGGRPIPGADPLLVEHSGILIGGRAVDIACGLGANALFVAERGYEVDAVDISFTALRGLDREAKRRGVPVRPILADLDFFPLPKDVYHLVLVFAYFSPELMPAIQDSLRPGGLLFYATYNHRHTSVHPGFNPKYLVPPGGLAGYLPGLNMVLDEPDAGDEANISRLIGRKP